MKSIFLKIKQEMNTEKVLLLMIHPIVNFFFIFFMNIILQYWYGQLLIKQKKFYSLFRPSTVIFIKKIKKKLTVGSVISKTTFFYLFPILF